MHYARTSDQLTIAYQVSGRGPALVWLPSLGNVEVSRRLADALPDGRLIELRGSTPTLFMENAAGDLDMVVRFLTTGRAEPPTITAEPPADGVTARELDVLRLLAAGDSNAEIARGLGITVHTVERHTANLYRKIGARGRADATAYALRRGIA